MESANDLCKGFPTLKTKKEAVEELDETIKQLKLHAESLGDNIKQPAKINPFISTTEMVTQAATSMKDAAGAVRAVREVAQSLLKTIASEIHPESRNTDQDLEGMGKTVKALLLSPETSRSNTKSPPNLQDVQKTKDENAKETSDKNIKSNSVSKYKDQNPKCGKKLNHKTAPEEISESEEDSFGYEDEVSVGIDLPALYTTSGIFNNL